MSELGSNARKLGHNGEALRWYAQAFEKSVGPATRLQWGYSYLAALVDLTPKDAARIEQTASTVLSEAGRDRGAFQGRSLRSLKRLGGKLGTWNSDGKHAAALRRLQARLDGLCAGVEAAEGQRAACETLLDPPGSKKPA
jgi:hypothetical protein